MRYRSRSLVICLLAVMAADVQAGWLFESREAMFESRRNTAKQIGVVILRDVHQLPQDEVERIYGTGFMSNRPAYSLRAEFRETFRGAPPTAPLKIPFTFIGAPRRLSYAEDQPRARSFPGGTRGGRDRVSGPGSEAADRLPGHAGEVGRNADGLGRNREVVAEVDSAVEYG